MYSDMPIPLGWFNVVLDMSVSVRSIFTYQINTRQQANLQQLSVNATKYQKAVHCIGVKVFNMLPFYIKAKTDNPKKI